MTSRLLRVETMARVLGRRIDAPREAFPFFVGEPVDNAYTSLLDRDGVLTFEVWERGLCQWSSATTDDDDALDRVMSMVTWWMAERWEREHHVPGSEWQAIRARQDAHQLELLAAIDPDLAERLRRKRATVGG